MLTVTGNGTTDFAFKPSRNLLQVDEGIHLAFAGISADGRVLASKIRLECQSYRYRMGTPPGVGYIARYVGERFFLLNHVYIACFIWAYLRHNFTPVIWQRGIAR